MDEVRLVDSTTQHKARRSSCWLYWSLVVACRFVSCSCLVRGIFLDNCSIRCNRALQFELISGWFSADCCRNSCQESRFSVARGGSPSQRKVQSDQVATAWSSSNGGDDCVMHAQVVVPSGAVAEEIEPCRQRNRDPREVAVGDPRRVPRKSCGEYGYFLTF